MANTITISALTEIMYKARDQVATEPTGFIQGVTRNGAAEGVSINGTVTSMRTAKPTLVTSYTPSMTPPDTADQTISADTMTLNLVAGTDIPLQGETFRQLANTVGEQAAMSQLLAQALRVIRNEIESKIAIAVKNGSSRAIGTAGTTPFASNWNTINSLRQILVDNGCPVDDRMMSLVISTAAGTNLRNLSQLTKVNEAATDATLRRGELLNISGFSIRESAGVASHTKGSGASYLTNGAVASGALGITVDTGTGTILAGDVLSASGGNHSYVVGTALASNVVTLNQPGAREAIADNVALTVGNNYTANLGFHSSAIELAMRPPAQPPGGDSGEHSVIVDPVTGLSFDMGLYKGYGMNQIKIICMYGVKVWKPEFVATLLG